MLLARIVGTTTVDEPFSGVDAPTQAIVLDILERLRQQLLNTYRSYLRAEQRAHDLADGLGAGGEGGDELGSLFADEGFAIEEDAATTEQARAFNAMSTRLRETVRSREQLLLDVSHELKTPLTRIKVALELGRADMPAVVRRNVGELEMFRHPGASAVVLGTRYGTNRSSGPRSPSFLASPGSTSAASPWT